MLSKTYIYWIVVYCKFYINSLKNYLIDVFRFIKWNFDFFLTLCLLEVCHFKICHFEPDVILKYEVMANAILTRCRFKTCRFEICRFEKCRLKIWSFDLDPTKYIRNRTNITCFSIWTNINNCIHTLHQSNRRHWCPRLSPSHFFVAFITHHKNTLFLFI